MARRCFICKKLDEGTSLSFHKLPADENRRNIWMSLLNLTDNMQLPKRMVICSNHFHPNDFEYRSNGLKFLKKDANPISVFTDESSTSSSGSTVSDDIPVLGSNPLVSAPEPNLTESEKEPDIETTSESTELDSPLTKRSKISIPEPILIQEQKKGFNENTFPSIHSIREIPESKRQVSSTSTASETEYQLNLMKHKSGEDASKGVLGQQSGFKRRLFPSAGSKKRKCFVGDLSTSDFSTPTKARKNLAIVKKTVATQRKKIRNLHTTVRRLRKKVTTLNALTKVLREKSYISESSEVTLKASLSGPGKEILEKLLKGPAKQKYDPLLRSFALTLSFYSPRAYNYVRSTFNRSLPHLSTISRWYRSIDGSPGFTQESLNALKMMREDAAVQGKQILCNLTMDEMSVRKQVEWTGSKFSGYIDIGTKLDSDQLPEAKEVLVFMLVSLNASWKIPVGFFFLDGLSGSEKAELVKKCLEFIHDSKVIVTSLTFDGHASNVAMATHLGANFTDLDKLVTKFQHPISGENIFIFFDPCHMIKLVRNCWGSKKILRNLGNNTIDWKYITELVSLQNEEGLHAATKIKMRHLQWVNEKMRVRLATQTLSKSVSDALLFLCKDLCLPQFEGVEATADFIIKFNNLFDIFNSRNLMAKYNYKKALSPENADVHFKFFDEMKNYILNLSLGDQTILKSARKTGFLGFLICMQSLRDLYKTYVCEKKFLKYILTYKLSQDHLELFFGAIRSKGGFNNNPTARQFEAAYKRLIVHTEVSGPDTGNTINLEKISILTSGSSLTINENGDDLQKEKSYLNCQEEILKKISQDIDKYDYVSSPSWDLTLYAQDVVSYISGFVVKSLKKCVTCAKCIDLLETDFTISNLQKRKTYGLLKNASPLIIDICQAAEKYFRFYNKTTNIFNKNVKNVSHILIGNTLKVLPVSVFDYFGDHLYEDDPIEGHIFKFIKLILGSYFKIRLHYETTRMLDISKKSRVRSINTKTVLFRNE